MPVTDESLPQIWASSATTALAATSFGPVDWVDETGSTNADLLAAAAQGAPHGRVLATDYQRAGRGRRARTWETAPGDALLMSVLVRPTVQADVLGAVTAAFGIAAVETCHQFGYATVGLKWPNDLVVVDDSAQGYRKLAGILAQSTISGDDIAVVVGMGLNVTGTELGETAIALDDLGEPPSRVDLLIRVVERFAQRYASLDSAEGLAADGPLWTAYRQHSVTLGTAIRVTTDTESIEGTAHDVATDGALMVQTHNGMQRVVAGDVAQVRPK